MDRLQVTQIEAASRQLHTAIELWITDRDPVSVHTLAFCAYQVTHDLNRANKGPPMVLDSEFIPKDRRSSWVNFVKNSSNFFKHADERKRRKMPESISLNEELTLVLLWYAAWGLEQLGQKVTPEVVAFRGVLLLKHPNLSDSEQVKPLKEFFAANPATASAFAQKTKKAVFDDIVAHMRKIG